MGTKIKTRKQIKADLDKIGVYPYDEVLKSLQSLTTTEERLNYLKDNDHYAKFEAYKKTLNCDEQALFSSVDIIKNYFPEESIIEERGGVRMPIDYRGTHIPSSIYEQFFRNNEYEVEWWFAKEMAQRRFNEWIEEPKTKAIASSKDSLQFNLSKIENSIDEANKLNIDITIDAFNNQASIEIRRIIEAGYYPKNKIFNWSKTALVYFEYVLKREYLQSLLNQSDQTTKAELTLDAEKNILDNAQPITYTYLKALAKNERFYFTTAEKFIEHYQSGIDSGKERANLIKFYIEYFINPVKEKHKMLYDFYTGNYFAPSVINGEIHEIPPITFETEKEYKQKIQDKCLVREIVKFENFLNNLQETTNNTDEKSAEKHTHIFRNNAFEVWMSMYNSFGITEKSRTDVKFIFEEMKKDGLIHKSVNQKAFLEWISDTHQITVEKTSNYSITPKRTSIYSVAKQMYKS